MPFRCDPMFEVDNLIQVVQECPVIWNKETLDYGDRNVREKNWNTVGERLFDNWKQMPFRDRLLHLKEMKSKWRNLRDTFFKSINQAKSADPALRRKKYVYTNALSFLLQTGEKKSSSVNIQEEDAESPPEESKANYSTPTVSNSGLSTHNSHYSGIKTKPLLKKSKLRKMTPFQNKLLEKLYNPKDEEEDADKMFLLSLLPDLKKLSDDDKLDFRIHTLEFFRYTRNKAGPPISTSYRSPTQPKFIPITVEGPPSSLPNFPQESMCSEGSANSDNNSDML